MDGCWGIILVGNILESLEDLSMVQSGHPALAALVLVIPSIVFIISIMKKVLDEMFGLLVFFVDVGVDAEGAPL